MEKMDIDTGLAYKLNHFTEGARKQATRAFSLVRARGNGRKWRYDCEIKEEYSSGPEINVILPGLVQMDKVSKVNQWLERRHGLTVLNKDDWVSVEEHLPDVMCRYCPWSEWPQWNDVDITESSI
ncbi:hypothetical protein Btru_041677 [Bulinus truncatus]|nr:hypothetical protein Btru_041677 [Bulinus truncatus]